MKTKELNAVVFAYILDTIEPYDDKELNTDKEKLQFLYDCFFSEYWYDYNKQRYAGNQVRGFADWLAGLPSVFTVAFEWYDIISLAKRWGSLPEDATERQEDKICENWFNLVANKTFQLFKRHNINTL